jgi:hypothetical protein
MAVYVDEPIWPWRGRLWCHLTADTTDELHAFATQLGLKRSSFQSRPGRPWRDHYDITEPKRRQAVALGAIELTLQEVAQQLERKRVAARGRRA